MNDKASTSIASITPLVVTGLFALLGTVAGSVMTGFWNVQLADRKFTSDLVLKALESGSATERLASLDLLVSTNLLSEPSIRAGVKEYVGQSKDDPSKIPQVKPASASLAAPIVDNARAYLLAGKQERAQAFESLRNDLTAAGFSVLGAKTLTDAGRPDVPEIRYFNASDRAQAEKIAEFMKFKLKGAVDAAESVPAKLYDDASAKPGYIEIWLGR